MKWEFVNFITQGDKLIQQMKVVNEILLHPELLKCHKERGKFHAIESSLALLRKLD